MSSRRHLTSPLSAPATRTSIPAEPRGAARAPPPPGGAERRGARGMAYGLSALCLWLWLNAAAGLRLTLLHTNDVHAHVEARGCAEGPRGCFGGVARRAARVAAERAAQRNVLLLDAGDQYQGTVWFSRFKGQEAVHFMNLLRYDAMVKKSGAGLPFLPGVPGVCLPCSFLRSVAAEGLRISGAQGMAREVLSWVKGIPLGKGVSWQPRSGACAEAAERMGCGLKSGCRQRLGASGLEGLWWKGAPWNRQETPRPA